jgi:hypothetical protein
MVICGAQQGHAGYNEALVQAVAKAVTGKEAVHVDCCSDIFEDNIGALA